MRTYLIRRLLLAVLTLVGVTIVVFFVMELSNTNIPERLIQNAECRADYESCFFPTPMEELRAFRLPVYERYLAWLGSMLAVSLGGSMWWGRTEVSALVARYALLSLQLGAMSLLIGTVLGISGGVVAALKQDTWLDYLIRGLAILGISAPTFWAGMMLILILVRAFDWIPNYQYTPLFGDFPPTTLAHLVLPALVIGLGVLTAIPLRMMRGTMLQMLREDYIRTAQAKGMRQRVIIVRHAMRNALIPVLTVIGIFLPITVTGLVVTEQVFGLPGVGRMVVDANHHHDYPVFRTAFTLLAFAVIFANLAANLLSGWLDPRIRVPNNPQ